jgi:hypothetical protein
MDNNMLNSKMDRRIFLRLTGLGATFCAMAGCLEPMPVHNTSSLPDIKLQGILMFMLY